MKIHASFLHALQSKKGRSKVSIGTVAVPRVISFLMLLAVISWHSMEDQRAVGCVFFSSSSSIQSRFGASEDFHAGRVCP
ncbi:hypothetical protein SSX86_017905 [Deinandra increscens subsp. villosa]|uniref:Uncharacterized protein n=1 Tax=Deinandra increscens subsp. villosa TaxID=3103831 RepID=A0AAP0GUP6_9ASTR